MRWGGTPVAASSKTAEVYDPVDNSWNPIASYECFTHAELGVAALGGKLYAVGGYAMVPATAVPSTNRQKYTTPARIVGIMLLQ